MILFINSFFICLVLYFNVFLVKRAYDTTKKSTPHPKISFVMTFLIIIVLFKLISWQIIFTLITYVHENPNTLLSKEIKYHLKIQDNK